MFAVSVMSVAMLVPMATVQDGASEAEDEQVARAEIIRREVKVEYQSLIVQRMMLQVRQMELFLKLDSKSVRRLEIASKGAAKKVADKYGERVADTAAQQATTPTVSLNGRMIEFPDDATDADDEVASEQPQRAALRVILNVRSTSVSLNCKTDNGSSGYGLGGGYNYAYKEKIWKDSLAAVTTKEQLQAFEKHLADHRRADAINLMVAVLALDLQLEASQVKLIHEWVSGQIGKVTDSDLQNGARWAISNLGRKLKPFGADKILTDAQLALLKAKLADWDR